MAPHRILIIRHAEKPHEPPCENDDGVKKSGEIDKESLTVRGWQRAGALVHFFTSEADLSPDAIFAAGIGEIRPSRRPKQTLMPLAEWLGIKIQQPSEGRGQAAGQRRVGPQRHCPHFMGTSPHSRCRGSAATHARRSSEMARRTLRRRLDSRP
jgi:hypothetical protein